MRAFFALLVLANLVLLAVFAGGPQDDDGSAPPLPAPAGAQPLVLISELPLADRPGKRTALSTGNVPDEVNVVADVAQADASLARERCYLLEGIPDGQALKRVISRLQEAGGRVGKSGEVSQETRRYWVVLPRFRSREQAAPVMARLRAAGIKDFYFVASGENKNTISLGLFSSAEAARRRVIELAPLKLKLHTREVVSASSSSYFLEVGWDRAAVELQQVLRPAASGAVRLNACPVSQ